jgi:drug/metabolite transporter (DMT)-like permease
MGNLLFYAVTILIWGSTWLAIKFQLGSVDPMLSVAYRFALAALLLLGYCALAGRPLRFTPKEHLWIALQGLFLFAFNYWLFYLAETQLTSGLVALVFSTIVLMNVFIGALLLGTPLEPRVLGGALIGLAGIALVFRPQLQALDLTDTGLSGLLLCLLATLLASLGNILSARNQRNRLPVLQTNAFGMGYGALLMLLVALASGRSLTIELTPSYLGALLYLAVFGSIVAFGCYLTLVGRIGAGRSAYVSLLVPLVALALSTLFEGYQWTQGAFFGMVLVLAGNLLILKPAAPAPACRETA